MVIDYGYVNFKYQYQLHTQYFPPKRNFHCFTNCIFQTLYQQSRLNQQNNKLIKIKIFKHCGPTKEYENIFNKGMWHFSKTKLFLWIILLKNSIQYAVKVQRSLAPLSWFPGSRKPTAHVHHCCRFQSYAKSRRLHAIANEIYKRNLHCVNHIPGIHDNGPPRTTLWRLTLTAY